MKKIVIIGSPGAGKTTFARKLGDQLNIRVFHLDRIFWERGWKEKPRDTRVDILQNLVQEKQWIIEGTYLGASECRLEAADTIIFLDTSPPVCLWRIIKRHHEYHGRSRRDIPEGCTDRLNLICILKVLAFPFRGRRTVMQKLRNYKSKQIIWRRSGKEVEGFLAQQKQDGDEKNSSSVVPLTKERLLVAARQ